MREFLPLQAVQVNGVYRFPNGTPFEEISLLRNDLRRRGFSVNGRAIRGSRFAYSTVLASPVPIIEETEGYFVGPYEYDCRYILTNRRLCFSLEVPRQKIELDF